MQILVLIVIVILMIINISIYHKIFNVIYFDFGKGCFMELFVAGLVAMFEIGLVLTVGKYIVGGLFKLLGFAGQLILIILAIAFVVFIIRKIVQMIKERANKELGDGAQDVEVTDNKTDIEEERKQFDVELAEIGSNKIKVIKAVREITGLELSEAKEFVDSSPKILKSASKEEANNIKTKLEAEGAKVILKLSHEPEVVTENSNIHMIACINCGEMINEDAKYCKFCGSKVPQVDMTVCTNCRKPIPQNANFCHYCGEKIRKDK